MVLGFKAQFEEKILKGTKIHTIREDVNDRWRKGIRIHMAVGVRTKRYRCFKEGVCTGITYIEIYPKEKVVQFLINGRTPVALSESWLTELSRNDGFDSVTQFWEWFNKPFCGKIIYWTDFKYAGVDK